MLLYILIATSQKIPFPPLIKCERVQSLKIEEHEFSWSVDCYRYYGEDAERYATEAFAIIRKHGAEVARWTPLQSPFCRVYRVEINPGYPVFAVRGAWGLGSHWDTMLFAIREGKLVKMGRPPAMNSNGPILWRGNKNVWAFDNYDRYEKMHNPRFRLRRVLMNIFPDGRLKKWKSVVTEHPRIPTTIHTPDDLNVPKSGF